MYRVLFECLICPDLNRLGREFLPALLIAFCNNYTEKIIVMGGKSLIIIKALHLVIPTNDQTSFKSLNWTIEIVLDSVDTFVTNWFLSGCQIYNVPSTIFLECTNFLPHGLPPLMIFNRFMVKLRLNNFRNSSDKILMSDRESITSDIISDWILHTWGAVLKRVGWPRGSIELAW